MFCYYVANVLWKYSIRVLISHELHGMFYLSVTIEWQELGNLCNKCPKQLIKQNSSYSDYFNATSGFTLNSRAPGGPMTFLLCFLTRIYLSRKISSESSFTCQWSPSHMALGLRRMYLSKNILFVSFAASFRGYSLQCSINRIFTNILILISLVFDVFFPASIRRLGQGNVFTPVWDSFYPQRGGLTSIAGWGVVLSRGAVLGRGFNPWGVLSLRRVDHS